MHTSRMVPLLFMIGGVFVEIAAEPARGQCQATEFAKLLASDGAPYDQFAGTVSVSGDVAVVGANLDDDAGANSGSAYVFCFDGSSWSQCAKLTASDAAPNDNFGSGVGISGDVAVIGAFGDDDESGAAYIFVKPEGGWANMTETYKLPAPDDAAPGDRFGHCLAISGSTIVIGAYLDDNDNGNNAGSAYVFRFDGTDWNQEAKLTASDGEPGDNFGSTGISTSRDVAVIGVFLDDNENGNDAGSAYVYRFDETNSNWNEEAKLIASDGADGDHFGLSVSISGEVAVVGARHNNGTGSAYVFLEPSGGWVSLPSPINQTAKLTASDAEGGDCFGRSVSISGDIVVIGTFWDDNENDNNAGSAYVFAKPSGGWASAASPVNEGAKLIAADGAAGDNLGISASISGDIAVVGAYKDDDNGTNSGSAYVFRGLSDCNDNGSLDICDIADATSTDANTNGIPDECEISVVVVDIKPGSYPNAINLGSHGVIPVAILTTVDFDATTVDPDTVELAGATVAIRGNGKKVLSAEEDVDGDGDIDLLLHVETENLDLETGVTEATLTGQTYDTQAIIGSDTIEIVPE